MYYINISAVRVVSHSHLMCVSWLYDRRGGIMVTLQVGDTAAKQKIAVCDGVLEFVKAKPLFV